VQEFDYRPKPFKQTAPGIEPRAAVKLNADGYSMDVMLPWRGLGLTPVALGGQFVEQL